MSLQLEVYNLRRRQRHTAEIVDELIERKSIRNEADRLIRVTERSDQRRNRFVHLGETV